MYPVCRDVETLLHQEDDIPAPILRNVHDILKNGEDTVVNIRFVNLSPTSPPVDIHIMGSTTKEATSLAYKHFTAFKSYPGTKAAFEASYYGNLTFEIRRSSDQQLMAYGMIPINPAALSNLLFRTVALVITGIYDADGTINPPDDQLLRVVPIIYY